MQHAVKLVAFDMDGTLTRSELFGIRSHRAALADFHLPPLTDEQIMSVYGTKAHSYMPTLLPSLTAEEIHQYLVAVGKYQLEFAAKYAQSYTGIPQALQTLKQQGYTLAVCSNAHLDYIDVLLTAMGIDSLFDVKQPLKKGGSKADSLQNLIAQTQAQAAVMVGDRTFDIEAARQNHILCIGCMYGLSPSEAQHADILVQSPAQIPQAVQQAIGVCQ